jgi:hypothetical protein
MKVRVSEATNCWRADPTQLSGTPPNGIGASPGTALDDLIAKLRNIQPGDLDAVFLPQMRRFGWPILEVTTVPQENEVTE